MTNFSEVVGYFRRRHIISPNIVTIGVLWFSQAERQPKEAQKHGHHDTRSATPSASLVSGSTSTSASSFSACLLPITVALILLSNP